MTGMFALGCFSHTLALAAAGAGRDWRFFTEHPGYIKGSNLEVKRMNVSDAKIECKRLQGCAAIWHHGGVTNDAVDVFFSRSQLLIVNSEEEFTTYMLRTECKATIFGHCKADRGVKCCDTRLLTPQCGKREDCETFAEQTSCKRNNIAKCPSLNGEQCCDVKESRCLITPNCPQFGGVPWMQMLGGMVLFCLVCGVFAAFAIVFQKNRGRAITPGAVVTVHDGGQAALAVVSDWDEGNKLWHCKLRDGRTLMARTSHMELIERPRQGSQEPLAKPQPR